jgi:predicted TPR repeat methyltransferase
MPDPLVPLREAARLRPDDADAHARLGRACLTHGRLAEAIEALQRAARLEPDDPAARTDLGRAWIAAADPAAAAFHLRRALALDPDASDARALLARAEAGASTLSADFVRELFDQYADKFDADMNALSYRAPDILRDLFARVVEGRLGAPQEARVVEGRLGAPQEARVVEGRLGAPQEARAFDVLDLGCGTGLSGLAFRARARTLVGVDLSPRMADKARARGIYDHVIVGDMIETARAMPGGFDLIVAADALGYVGDLAPLFAALRAALRPGGWFAATAEESPDAVMRSARASPPDFALGPARRFRHGEAHLRRTAEGAGFAVVSLERRELRRDRGEPVAGLAFILDF